jgi:cation diffusion facilitator CzcD-associated flavoprotein CzcO
MFFPQTTPVEQLLTPPSPRDLDVLIVGAGFSGIYLLYEMRKQGYKTTLYDAGTGFGGTW